MCRTGGRRCPGEHDPAKVAARNARRRAKYAADKGSKSTTGKKKTATVEKLLKTAEKSTSEIPEQITLVEAMETDENLQQGQDTPADSPKTEVNPRRARLGLSTISAKLTKTDKDFYQSNVVRGTIDYTKLDEQSFAEFGFEDPKVTKQSDLDKLNKRRTLSLSKKELKKTTMAEKIAFTQFTREGVYEWVNKAAYSPSEVSKISYQGLEKWDEPQPLDKIFDETLENPKKCSYLRYPEYNIQTLEKVTNELDSGLAKGPKKQRILYRGLTGNALQLGGLTAKEWVAQNRAIGTEVVFDGYTSTTTSPKIAEDRTNYDNPIAYQILTPEGMAISSVSDFDKEEEVLLPRNQRYMVVGVHETPIRHSWGSSGKKIQIIQMVAINSKGEILDGTNSDPVGPLVTTEKMNESRKRYPTDVMLAAATNTRLNFYYAPDNEDTTAKWKAAALEEADKILTKNHANEFKSELAAVDWEQVKKEYNK